MQNIVVKAAGWLSLDRQFEPYPRANMVAPSWCGLGCRSRTLMVENISPCFLFCFFRPVSILHIILHIVLHILHILHIIAHILLHISIFQYICCILSAYSEYFLTYSAYCFAYSCQFCMYMAYYAINQIESRVAQLQ